MSVAPTMGEARPPRPPQRSVDEFSVDAVPAALMELPQWTVWRHEWEDDEWKKIPINARTGRRASSTDPSTWCSFEVALARWRRDPSLDGVQFAFSKDDKLVGIDLDDCIDADSEVHPEAQAVVEGFATFTEISPSGTGLKMFMLATKRGEARCKKVGVLGCSAVEIYELKRFFTVTGIPLPGTPRTVNDGQLALDSLMAKLWPPEPDPTRRAASTSGFGGAQGLEVADDELLAQARGAANGAKFRLLFDHGDTSGYGSDDNRADLALCSMLAFWCGPEAARIDRFFRGSALMRPKWDKMRGATTYGQRTISKALSKSREFFAPHAVGGWMATHAASAARPDSNGTVGTTSNGAESVAAAPAEHDPVADLESPLTDLGNAVRLAERNRDRLRWVFEEGAWRVWQGGRWVVDTGQAQEAAKAIARSWYRDAVTAVTPKKAALFAAWAQTSSSAHRIEAMLKLARSEPGMTVMVTDFDADPWLLNAENGVIDLRTGRLLPHDPKYLMTKIAGAPYDPDALCPAWDAHLKRIFRSRPDMVPFILRALGYTLLGSNPEDALFIMHGFGHNGKTTTMDAILPVFGDYAQVTAADTLLQARSKRGGPRDDIACLRGARLVIASEVDEGSRFDEALVKTLTGGEPITCRPLYGKFFSFVPPFAIWIATNHKPAIRGTDEGIWRRIHLLPFAETIGADEKDVLIDEKLAAERAGILASLVRGFLDWQQNGLALPEAVVSATAVYRAEEDRLGEFIEECCVVDPERHTLAGVLYEAYVRWAEENAVEAMSQTAFGTALGTRGHASDKHKVTRKKVRLGIALRTANDS